MIKLLKDDGLNTALVGQIQSKTGRRDGDFVPCEPQVIHVKAEITYVEQGKATLKGKMFNWQFCPEDGCQKINAMLRLIGHNAIQNEDRYGSPFFSYQPVFDTLQADSIVLNWVATQKARNGIQKIQTLRKVWTESDYIQKIEGDLIPRQLDWDSTILLFEGKPFPFKIERKRLKQMMENLSISIFAESSIGNEGRLLMENFEKFTPSFSVCDGVICAYQIKKYLWCKQTTPPFVFSYEYEEQIQSAFGKECLYIDFDGNQSIAPFSISEITSIYGEWWNPKKNKRGIQGRFENVFLLEIKRGTQFHLAICSLDYWENATNYFL